MYEFRYTDITEEDISMRRRPGTGIYEARDRGFAYCFDGFVINRGGISLVEPNVYDMSFVKAEAEGQGIGTALVGAVLQEAHNRGFSYVRYQVANPRMITVMNKAVDTNIVDRVIYTLTAPEHMSSGDNRTTKGIVASPNHLSPEAALTHLSKLPTDEDGMITDRDFASVEGIIALNNRPY